ncbi:MAG: tungstate ABC transporter substrate-binding protein WtpA [Methanomicrobiales archaeon]|nr:tungstate ABC transporter substrate-binding protein WtpA [Methanomicrobiales archaeon]
MLLVGAWIAGCTTTTTAPPKGTLLISTTTSLYDPGLLDYLRPEFEKEYNCNVLITSQGTGKAIELARRGDVDMLLVHDPARELLFLEDGFGLNRRCFAYNYFLLVGPATDPAGVKDMKPEDAFKKILTEGKKGTAGVAFVSRGDASGTHAFEQGLWKAAGYTYAKDVQKSGAWYIEAGKGMGETLVMASEKSAYTLTDIATYLAFKSNLQLVPIVDKGDSLRNIYTAISINPLRYPGQNLTLANNYINFLLRDSTQQKIANYGMDKYGIPLYYSLKGATCTQFKCECTGPVTATVPLRIFHAGSLAGPLAKLEAAYEKAHPEVDVQLISAGSVDAIKKITEQNKKADVLASADYTLIPQMMIPANASWYVNFAKNDMVIAYTDASEGAAEITAANWYQVLNRQGVSWAISDPNSDPAGYRSLMAIQLAQKTTGDAALFNTLVSANSNITISTAAEVTTIDARDIRMAGTKFMVKPTANDVVAALKAGTIDYGWEYRSVAVQNGLKFVDLPEAYDLSSVAMASTYAKVQVKTVKGTTESTYVATPIVYGATVPTSAEKADLGIDFVKLMIGSEGQAIFTADGQVPIAPAQASGTVPDALKPLITT